MERGRKIIQISILGIFVNLILAVFKTFVGILTGSVAVVMDAVNNLSDALLDSVISLSTLAAAAVSLLFHIGMEGWLGIVIAVVILKAGAEILMESLSGLIGARVDSELSTEMKRHICQYPQVNGAYDLALHRYGPERIIGSVHVEAADDMTAGELHGLFRSIMQDIYANYGIIMILAIDSGGVQAEQMVENVMKKRSVVY